MTHKLHYTYFTNFMEPKTLKLHGIVHMVRLEYAYGRKAMSRVASTCPLPRAIPVSCLCCTSAKVYSFGL